MRTNLLLPVLALALFSACSFDHHPTQLAAESVELDLSHFAERRIHEPQFFADGGGGLLLVWREKTEEGSDLFVARRGADGSLGAETRINDQGGTVASYPHDEMRAAVAIGPDGVIGAAWSDDRGQVRAAVSRDGGSSFEPSVRLEQTDKKAYRGFPALAFDDDSVLHAVWIDSRFADGMAEEPADLYYARVVDGTVTESNVTADQEASVCGCCRTYLEISDQGTSRALFRNSTVEGYRDIFTAQGTETGMTTPTLIGQPLWKIQGCPMAGPIAVGDRVVWPDGSQGRKLLMVAPIGSEPARPLFTDEQLGDWVARLSARKVATNESTEPLVLLPGGYSSRLVSPAASGTTWTILAEDLPRWATSAFYEKGSLLLIGSVDGVVETERRSLEL